MEPRSRDDDRPEPGAPDWDAPGGTYPRGVELFHQGQVLQEVVQIVSGLVKLTQTDTAGTQSIVGLAGAGDWLGTAAVIADDVSPVSAVTCSDALLKRVSSRTFRRKLQQEPQLASQILRAHARELCRQVTWIGQMCSLGSLARLQCVLCRFASQRAAPSGSAIKLQLPLHQWELASLIGVTPEHLSRLLKDLEHADVIRRDKGWIVIQDPRRLCAETGAPGSIDHPTARVGPGGRR